MQSESGPMPCLRFELYGCGTALPTLVATTQEPHTTRKVIQIITEGAGRTEAQHFHHTTRKPFVHPCHKANGGCSQTCTKVGMNAVCECREGFELKEDGKTCTEGD